MTREEAIKRIQQDLDVSKKYLSKEYKEALGLAIEALSQPNYETDTEVRLAVTNRKKEKVILWDAYGEVEYYPIEALSAEATDLISRADAIKAIESRQTEQWIDADIDYNNGLESAVAEIKALPSADRPTELLKDGTLKVNVQNGTEVNRALVWGDDGCGGLYYADDRPSGEWVIVNKGLDIYICDQCGEVEQIQRIPIWDYCPNCGAKMGSDTR